MKPLLEISNLTFERGTFRLSIPALAVTGGEILCIAGPNGGGKTTYLECACGLLSPKEGRIYVNGKMLTPALAASKSHIGYIPDDENWFIKELCAREYFELLMSVYWTAGVTVDMRARCDSLAKLLRFTAFEQPIQQLSHGNKKKVQIIAALMHMPKVVIMDEVRNGLDPLAVIAVEHIIRNAAKDGACILAATHDLWWAERLGTTILLLDNGKPILNLPVEQVCKTYGHIEQAFLELVE